MGKISRQAKTEGTPSKSRRGFNFIDVLLILFILLVIVAAVNIVSPMSVFDRFKTDSERTIEYTVEIIGVDGEFIDKIKEQDVAVDAISKYTLGTVEAVDYNTQYSELKYDEAANAGVLAVYPEKYNVLVTVKATGSYVQGEGFSINGRRIAVGEKLSIRFPDFVCEGYCISLSADE